MSKLVKRAVWKHPDQPERQFFLEQVERACFRWLEPANNRWDGVDYLDIGTALKAMRLYVESDPSCVGVDLTVFEVDPGPEERAALRILNTLWGDIERSRKDLGIELDRHSMVQRTIGLIAHETNIGPMTAAFSELIAFLMTRRVALCCGLALASMPPPVIESINRIIQSTGQTPGRDLAFDGLLHGAITEMGKSTGRDFTNLLKPLIEPVSKIVQARVVPKPPEGSLQ